MLIQVILYVFPEKRERKTSRTGKKKNKKETGLESF
jgi:hypothetical protein